MHAMSWKDPLSRKGAYRLRGWGAYLWLLFVVLHVTLSGMLSEAVENMKEHSREEILQRSEVYCSELDLADDICALLKEEAQNLVDFPSFDDRVTTTSSATATATGQYSSFTCTAGNQKFPSDWNDILYGDNAYSSNRVCKLTNVCWLNQKFHYYRHPEEQHAPAAVKLFNHEFVNLPVEDTLAKFNIKPGWSIDISEDTAIPADLEFLDEHTWFMVYGTYSYNFAHLLFDDLFPIQTAMSLFDIDPNNSRLVYMSCSQVPSGGVDSEMDINKWRKKCATNFETYSRLMWGKKKAHYKSNTDNNGNNVHKEQEYEKEQIAVGMEEWGRSQEKEKFCLKEVVIGQGHVFGNRKFPDVDGDESNGGYAVTRSYNFPDRYFGISLRRCRDAVVKNLQNPVLSPPSVLRVLIIPKTQSLTTPSLHPDLCSAMTTVLAELVPVMEVVCLQSGGSVEEEISLVRTFPLIIAEHGTVSYLSIFGHDHTVLISVGHQRGMKELDTLSFATHIKVLFTTFEDKPAMAQLVRYGLHLAATGFNLSLEKYIV